jgi:hypothetical protein
MYQRDLNSYKRKRIGPNEKIFQSVLQMDYIGYYHGVIVAFRFKSTCGPFILFQYHNEAFERSLEVILLSFKPTARKKENKKKNYDPIESYLKILCYEGKEFHWVIEVSEA